MSLAFLPLYFNEEDMEIWEQLKRVDPEQRSLLIKNILRQALVENSDQTSVGNLNLFSEEKFDPAYEEKFSPSYENEVSDSEGRENIEDLLDLPEDEPVKIEISLEDLFVSSVAYEEPSIPQVPTDSESFAMKGLDYLLNRVIGEEKDDELLKFINTTHINGEDQ